MGQDQVSRRVSVPCWLHVATPVAMFYEHLPLDYEVQFGNKVNIGVMSDQLIMSLYMGMHMNFNLGEGDFKIFDETPISTIELPDRRFQTISDIFLAKKNEFQSQQL